MINLKKSPRRTVTSCGQVVTVCREDGSRSVFNLGKPARTACSKFNLKKQ